MNVRIETLNDMFIVSESDTKNVTVFPKEGTSVNGVDGKLQLSNPDKDINLSYAPEDVKTPESESLRDLVFAVEALRASSSIGDYYSKEINLSTISSGFPQNFIIGEFEFGRIVSLQINQDTVSLSGVAITLIESNDNVNWFDVLRCDNSNITTTSETTNESLTLYSDLISMRYVGVSVDVSGSTTGSLIIYLHSISNS